MITKKTIQEIPEKKLRGNCGENTKKPFLIKFYVTIFVWDYGYVYEKDYYSSEEKSSYLIPFGDKRLRETFAGREYVTVTIRTKKCFI